MQEVQNPKLESIPNANPIFIPPQPPPKKKDRINLNYRKLKFNARSICCYYSLLPDNFKN